MQNCHQRNILFGVFLIWPVLFNRSPDALGLTDHCSISATGYVIEPLPGKAKGCTLWYISATDPRGFIPMWAVNKGTQYFAPRVRHASSRSAHDAIVTVVVCRWWKRCARLVRDTLHGSLKIAPVSSHGSIPNSWIWRSKLWLDMFALSVFDTMLSWRLILCFSCSRSQILRTNRNWALGTTTNRRFGIHVSS